MTAGARSRDAKSEDGSWQIILALGVEGVPKVNIRQVQDFDVPVLGGLRIDAARIIIRDKTWNAGHGRDRKDHSCNF